MRNNSRKKSMDISWKNDAGHYVRRSAKFPGQERNKRRDTSLRTENNGPYKAFKLGFPFEYLRLTENPEF